MFLTWDTPELMFYAEPFLKCSTSKAFPEGNGSTVHEVERVGGERVRRYIGALERELEGGIRELLRDARQIRRIDVYAGHAARHGRIDAIQAVSGRASEKQEIARPEVLERLTQQSAQHRKLIDLGTAHVTDIIGGRVEKISDHYVLLATLSRPE